MIFETTEKINKWVKQHQVECKTDASAGEQFIYEFIPSGIFQIQTVRCICCYKKFTDYIDY